MRDKTGCPATQCYGDIEPNSKRCAYDRCPLEHNVPRTAEPLTFGEWMKDAGKLCLEKLAATWEGFIDAVGLTGALVIFALIIGAAIMIYALATGQNWEKYAREYNCVSTGETRAVITHGSIHVGEVTVPTVSTSIETKYRCDYWH